MFKANIIIKYCKMKKQFLNLGKALNKAEQKQINGGVIDCPSECQTALGCSKYCGKLLP